MKDDFLMQNNEWVERLRNRLGPQTYVSEPLRSRLILAAMKRACRFYCDFFGQSIEHVDYAELLARYEAHARNARSLGLFQPGGIREKEHLNLWCLSNVLAPACYIESGVFIGSSLHAMVGSPSVMEVIGIDPDLSRLKIPGESLPPARFIDDQDFSQLEIDVSDVRALAYFDDHVDSAGRVLQSCEKGLRYLLFDDSTGLEGVCQRSYPAVPTIPMIMNIDMFHPGDELSWVVGAAPGFSPRAVVKRWVLRRKGATQSRIRLVFTQALIDKCQKARRQISKCERLPDLGEFLPQARPETVVDSGKYLVELEQIPSASA